MAQASLPAPHDFSSLDSGSEDGNSGQMDAHDPALSDGVEADAEDEGEQEHRIAAALERIRLARDSGSDTDNEVGNPDHEHHTSSSSASSEPSSEDESDDDWYDYLR